MKPYALYKLQGVFFIMIEKLHPDFYKLIHDEISDFCFDILGTKEFDIDYINLELSEYEIKFLANKVCYIYSVSEDADVVDGKTRPLRFVSIKSVEAFLNSKLYRLNKGKWKRWHNRVKCSECNDIIESLHRHDFVKCSCDQTFVDGGISYVRTTPTAIPIPYDNEDS